MNEIVCVECLAKRSDPCRLPDGVAIPVHHRQRMVFAAMEAEQERLEKLVDRTIVSLNEIRDQIDAKVLAKGKS